MKLVGKTQFLVLTLILLICSCGKDKEDGKVAPIANFSASSTSVNIEEYINFNDLSTGEPTSWSWTFQGGTPNSSTEQNPTIQYKSEGKFDVFLTVMNDKGYNMKANKSYITVTNIPKLPVILTSPISNITSNSATSGGNISDIGSNIVTSRGVCWSTITNPTISDNKTTNGSGLGGFVSNITGLSPNTKYYLRAYATNSNGTSYGDEISFTTIALPTITTSIISDINNTTAISGGNISNQGSSSVTARGVCWSTSTNPTITNSKTANGSGIGSFISNITGLTANTKYFVRAYATNSIGTAYGEELSFTTPSLPVLSTSPISNISNTSATSGGNISSSGSSSVTISGVCWSTNPNPTTSNNKTTNGSSIGSFVSNITGLTANTKYYLRAYATNSVGTAYGNELIFTTTNTIQLPILTTTNISNISTSTASSGGFISSEGSSAVSSRGVCWSKSPNPTTTNNKTTNGSGTGSFTSSITGLSINTTYYVRAYAANSSGTAYGNEISFTTSNSSQAPILSTNSISETSTTTATTGGNIISQGGSSVTERGVCWGINPNPSIINNKTSNGSGIGSFTSYLTGLAANTTYYVRSYATNSSGTAYGNELSFTTLAIPVLTTVSPIYITNTTATSGGNVTNQGGSAVTERGVCWSISPNPTIENSKSNNGNGTGGYVSIITNLIPNTTYYVRAYATNSGGTAYGNERVFATTNYTPLWNTVTDIEGNVYQTITIGTQSWMTENLKTSKYNDGTDIIYRTSYTDWSDFGFGSGAYCYYNNDIGNNNIYGKLYNWLAVSSGKLCPKGWHVPTDAEWSQLSTNFLGGAAEAGGKMKTIGNNSDGSGLWASPNTGATNESNFTGLPGGYRSSNGSFLDKGGYGYWWSSTSLNSETAWSRILGFFSSNLDRKSNSKKNGYSCRCIKD